jgi:Serine dehydrogenase proteinase
MYDQHRAARERAAMSTHTPPIMFDRTQRLLEQVGRHIGEPLLTYWGSSSGSICKNDVIAMYPVLQRIGTIERLSLFVKSGGGSGEASLRMVHLLRQHVKHLTVLVPLECASAATMLALGADRIMMGPLAHLSAVDTALTHDLSPLDRDNQRVRVSQDELQRVTRLWQAQADMTAGSDGANPYASLFQYVHPLVIGAVDRSSALSTRLCIEILAYHMRDTKKAEDISDILNSGYPSHSYPITLREAQRIGLDAQPLDEALKRMLLDLNETYCEMGQRATTDYDERNSHDNSILNVIEGCGVQKFYQNEKDWHYRVEERRWIALNDRSSWRKTERSDEGVRVRPRTS